MRSTGSPRPRWTRCPPCRRAEGGSVTEPLLTAREVADTLGVTAETVLRWTRPGELPAIGCPGGAIRYREADIDAWIEEHETGAAPGRGSVSNPDRRPPGQRVSFPVSAIPLASAAQPRRTRCQPIQRGSRASCRPARTSSATTTRTASAEPAACSRRRAPPSQHYREVIEPQLRGDLRGAPPELTLAGARRPVPRNGTRRSGRRGRCGRSRNGSRVRSTRYGDTQLSELERMGGELADWRATLRPRYAPM